MTQEITIRIATESDLAILSELAGALARMHHDVNPIRFFLSEDVEKDYEDWLKKS